MQSVFHNNIVRCSPSEAGALLTKISGVQNQKDNASASHRSTICSVQAKALKTTSDPQIQCQLGEGRSHAEAL